MSKLIFPLVNWYTKNFSFPRKGLKYFIRLLKLTGDYNKTYLKKLPNGCLVRVNPTDHIQRQIFWYGSYERKYVFTWENFVGNTDVVFDIGANIGYYSLVASSKARMVYAFEPYQTHLNELIANVRLNNINNVEALNLAVSDCDQEMKLFISSEENTGMTGLAEPANFSGRTEKANTISLDRWIEEGRLPKPNLLKMDIEGAEWTALKGMQRVLRDALPVVFIEIASPLLSKFASEPSDIYQFMNELGYKAYQVIEQNKLNLVNGFVDDELIVFIPDSFRIPSAIEVA